MSLSAFDDKNHPPRAEDPEAALGPAYAPWSTLLALVAERMSPLADVWRFTGMTDRPEMSGDR